MRCKWRNLGKESFSFNLQYHSCLLVFSLRSGGTKPGPSLNSSGPNNVIKQDFLECWSCGEIWSSLARTRFCPVRLGPYFSRPDYITSFPFCTLLVCLGRGFGLSHSKMVPTVSAAGVVVSCKIPILASRVRFPGGAWLCLPLFPSFANLKCFSQLFFKELLGCLILLWTIKEFATLQKVCKCLAFASAYACAIAKKRLQKDLQSTKI